MSDHTLHLTPTETVTVRRAEAGMLEVEVTYGPGAPPPPPHAHPDQDERFQILSGVVRAEVDGVEHVLRPGDALAIPRGTVHTMRNGSDDEPARAIWETTPAGRTLEWFTALDRLQFPPDPAELGALLAEYSDVISFGVPAAA